ncbi:unnamed protein product [Amoebophrya sp. A25]|nr:unnamed protein product [Amoebophrya sp. A25]|eukprot:GSA25T00010805001.1
MTPDLLWTRLIQGHAIGGGDHEVEAVFDYDHGALVTGTGGAGTRTRIRNHISRRHRVSPTSYIPAGDLHHAVKGYENHVTFELDLEPPRLVGRGKRNHYRSRFHNRYPFRGPRRATAFFLDCTAEEPAGVDFRVVDDDAVGGHSEECTRYRDAFQKKEMVSNLKIMSPFCGKRVWYWLPSSNLWMQCCVPPAGGSGARAQCEAATAVLGKPADMFEKMKSYMCKRLDPYAVLIKTQSTSMDRLKTWLKRALALMMLLEVVGAFGGKDATFFMKHCDETDERPCCDKNSGVPCSLGNMQSALRGGTSVMYGK